MKNLLMTLGLVLVFLNTTVSASCNYTVLLPEQEAIAQAFKEVGLAQFDQEKKISETFAEKSVMLLEFIEDLITWVSTWQGPLVSGNSKAQVSSFIEKLLKHYPATIKDLEEWRKNQEN